MPVSWLAAQVAAASSSGGAAPAADSTLSFTANMQKGPLSFVPVTLAVQDLWYVRMREHTCLCA
jgi:hypothetical protein